MKRHHLLNGNRKRGFTERLEIVIQVIGAQQQMRDVITPNSPHEIIRQHPAMYPVQVLHVAPKNRQKQSI